MEIRKTISKIIKKDKWKLYEEKKNLFYLPLEKILEYQTKKLRRLLKKAYLSPYYKKIIDSLKIPIEEFQLSDLKKFPFLTKDIIRKEKENLLVKGAKGVYQNSSGGSTGEPINFYQDQNYKDEIWATMGVINDIIGLKYGGKVAKLWGAPQDQPSLKTKIGNFLRKMRFYDSFNMSEKNMWAYHQDMERFQPDVIISYASSIYLFAQFLEKNKIKPNYPRVSISTSAETLFDHMRETIQRVFNVPIFDKYGSREVSAIAIECEKHNGLHIFMDNVILESIDPSTGKEIWESPGELVVTDLNNYAMPFIRYRIGDMGILTKQQCSCKRNTFLIKKLMGRTTDNFLLKNGRIVHGEYFTHLFYGLEGIKEFQFVQEDLDAFNLYIVKTEKFSEDELKKIEEEILKIVGKESRLSLHFVNEIPRTKTGKYRFTISKIDLSKMLNYAQQ